METWAIILAAGESSRMQKNKLLLPVHNKTIIELVIENVLNAGIDNIIVVLGPYRDEMMPIISKMKVRYCYNENYKQGMLSSIQCAFRNIPISMEAAIIFLGDQPVIPGEVARTLMESFTESQKGILIPVYMGKRGHPVLISKSYRNEVEELISSEGLRALINKFSGDVLEIEVDSPGILKDIDIPQDYINLTNT